MTRKEEERKETRETANKGTTKRKREGKPTEENGMRERERKKKDADEEHKLQDEK